MTLAATLGSRLIVLVGGRVVLLLVALVTTAMLTRFLGTTGFGHYRTAVAYLALVIALADLGLANLFVREISRPGADQPRLIANALGLRLAVAGGALIVAIALAFVLPLDPEDRLGIVGGAAGYLAYAIHLLLFGLFQQQLKQQGVMIAEVTGGLLLMGLIVFFGWLGAAPFWFVVALGLSYLVTLAVTLYAAQRLVPFGLRMELPVWRDLARGAAPLAVSIGISVLYFRADTVLLALLRPAADVGLYGVPIKILDSCMGITMLMVGLFAPLLAGSARVDEPGFRGHLQNGLLTITVGNVGIGVGLVALAPEIVVILGGAEFAPAAPILRVLAGVLVLHGTTLVFRDAAMALTIQHRLIPAYCVGLVVAMVAYLVLIPPLGGVGAAWALLSAEAVVTVIVGVIVGRTANALGATRTALATMACGIVAVAVVLLAEGWGAGWLVRVPVAGAVYLALLLGSRTVHLPSLLSVGREMLARKGA